MLILGFLEKLANSVEPIVNKTTKKGLCKPTLKKLKKANLFCCLVFWRGNEELTIRKTFYLFTIFNGQYKHCRNFKRPK